MTATVTVIGVDGADLLPAAASALAGAHVLVGLRAHLDRYGKQAVDARPVELAAAAIPETVLDDLFVTVTAGNSAVVLVDGDPGFFGGLRTLRGRGLPVVTFPAVSSLQRLAAMIKRPLDDVTVVSAHNDNLRRVANVCRARRAVAVLTAPGAGPAELAAALDGWRRNLAVLEDVGGPNERLSIVDATEAVRRHWRSPNLVLCLVSLDATGVNSWIAGGEVSPPADGWALDVSAFATRTGVGIPPEVVALALAKLAPRAGNLVWDVAAGSGAVGIESGRLGAAVISVESDPGLCVRIIANAGSHGVDLRLADGPLLESLRELPQPDSVFLGDARVELVQACTRSGAGRIVVHVDQLDKLGPAREALAAAEYTVDGCQLTSAPLDGLRLGPASSAFLLWAAK